MNSELTDFVPAPPAINFTDTERESYQSKVHFFTQAIQAGKLQKAILSRSVKVKGDLDVLKTYVAGNI